MKMKRLLPYTATLLSLAAFPAAPSAVLGGPAGAATPATLAADEAVGGLSGTITDAAGKPAAKVPVLLFDSSSMKGGTRNPDQGKGGKGGGGAGRLSTGAAEARDLLAPERGSSGTPTARTTTDAEGKYEFAKKLKPGWYMMKAGTRAGGYREEAVEVKAGEMTKKDVQLTPAAGGGGNGGDDGDRRR